MGVGPLGKRPRGPLPLLPCADTAGRGLSLSQEVASPDTEPTFTLILDFLPRSWERTCPRWSSCPVDGVWFCRGSLSSQRQEGGAGAARCVQLWEESWGLQGTLPTTQLQ